MSALLEKIDETAAGIKSAFGTLPEILVVAGSGLGGFAATLANAKTVSYDKLKNFPVSTVVGHAGTLVVGECAGKPIIVMNGRKHLYEGVDINVTTLPLRALLRAGVKIVILSNAAGGLNVKFDVGDLMLITDHINNMAKNPLIGANLNEVGPRFPDMSQPYDRKLMDVARKAALKQGIALREGVYIAGTGPSYETQAEVQMLRMFADAVGMSTVPENIVAVHAGARVLGISVITNSLVQRTDVKTTHEEVTEVGKISGKKFTALVEEIVRSL